MVSTMLFDNCKIREKDNLDDMKCQGPKLAEKEIR